MLNIDATLKVGFGASTGTTFTDDRIAMGSFSDNRVVTPTTGQNAMQIKFTKPINAIFVYLPTPASTDENLVTMTAFRPDGTTPIPFTNFVDGTRGLSQSGFIYWTPQYDVAYNAVAGQEFTYQFNYASDIDATFGGVNLLFCDKFDLLREYPDLDNLLGITNEAFISPQLIRLMESTMLEIERRVANSNILKQDRQYFLTNESLDRWDLLQINQLNQASIYWTIGKIFYFLSDNPNDIYSQKASAYTARGQNAFESVDLSIDLNDDGSLDVFEGEREYGNVEITWTL